MSLMCMAPGVCLWAQEAVQESSEVKLKPQKNSSGKWGFVDEQGKEVIPFKYEAADKFSEGLAAIKLDGKWGGIDEQGKEVIPFIYDYAGEFSEGLARVLLNKKWGFIDKTGQEVVPRKYERTEAFSEGLAQVRLNGEWGFIDKTGEQVISCKYEHTEAFSEGLAQVWLNGKWGFIDKTGEQVISCTYGEAKSFSEGIAAVSLKGKWGFIDKTGQEIIPCKYDHLFRSHSATEKALVELENSLKQIDGNGTETDATSQWPGLPIKIEDKWVVDFTIGSDELGNTCIKAIIAPEFSLLGLTFISGKKEYTSKLMHAKKGLSVTFNFETAARPETVIFFSPTNSDEKIRIKCKEQKTGKLK